MPQPLISGRKALLVCAALVIVLGGTAGWFMVHAKPHAGAYIDVLALDSRTVVGVRAESSGRAFVELVDTEMGSAGMRWQALVPKYRVPDGAIGLAASVHAITVRFPREGHTQVWGFATESARKLGSVVLAERLPDEDDGMMADGVATLSTGRMSYELLAPDGRPAHIYALSLDDGEIAWDHELPERDIRATWLTDRHLVVVQPESTSVLDRDGHFRAIQPGGGCVIAGAADLLVHEVDGAAVVESLEDGSVLSRTPLGGASLASSCGRRGANVAAVVQAGAHVQVWLLGDAQSNLQTIDLGEGHAAPPPVAAPLSLPFAGELPDVAVVALDTALVGVDLKKGAVAWRDPLKGTVVDAGDAVLVQDGDLLTSVAPATGATRAVHVPDSRPLRAHHVAAGTVWLAGDHGLAALDAVTLEVRATWKTPPSVTSASP